jgi:beta-phosphoglucomutase-like phosphatase (HAD superfamily)
MIEFSDPYTMAQHLSRKRLGAGTIYKMVISQFGYSPTREEIYRLKGEYAMRRMEMRVAARNDEDRTEYMSESERQQMMKDGSEALLRALWRHHGNILSHYKSNGLNVVMP